MKITTYARYEWNDETKIYELVEEDSYNYEGPVARCDDAPGAGPGGGGTGGAPGGDAGPAGGAPGGGGDFGDFDSPQSMPGFNDPPALDDNDFGEEDTGSLGPDPNAIGPGTGGHEMGGPDYEPTVGDLNWARRTEEGLADIDEIPLPVLDNPIDLEEGAEEAEQDARDEEEQKIGHYQMRQFEEDDDFILMTPVMAAYGNPSAQWQRPTSTMMANNSPAGRKSSSRRNRKAPMYYTVMLPYNE